MKKHNFKYLYGPVWSWRLGKSLGIDLLSQKYKVCSFDCIYCQIRKKSLFSKKTKIYVQTKEIISEIKSLPKIDIDYITFSGRGEPALAKNLGRLIKEIRRIRKERIAVLTNSTLLSDKEIRKNLKSTDFVIAKLDAYSQESLDLINKPAKGIKFKDILSGIKRFRKVYKGRFALQIMFTKQNESYADKLADLAREIKPDEVQINTPLRPNKCKPLSRGEIARIKEYFQGLKIISVYDKKPENIIVSNMGKILERRGKEK